MLHREPLGILGQLNRHGRPILLVQTLYGVIPTGNIDDLVATHDYSEVGIDLSGVRSNFNLQSHELYDGVSLQDCVGESRNISARNVELGNLARIVFIVDVGCHRIE